MIARRLISHLISRSLFACWSLGATSAMADSILAGKVTDRITEQPVVAAEVDVMYSEKVLGSATTDADGFYRVPFKIPPDTASLVTMKVRARGTRHGLETVNIQVRDGTPVEPTHNISLYPIGTTECVSHASHSVIVGYFRPPLGQTYPDLSARIADSLRSALEQHLQTAVTLKPSFEPCEPANPKTPALGAKYAKALRAHAFVAGSIEQTTGSPHFAVQFYVSDAYGLFGDPKAASSKSINLNNPSGAPLVGEIHVAVLAAIAAGLAEKSDYVAAITVLSVAEHLLGVTNVPPYIALLRKKYQALVPNAGLRKATQ